MATDTPHGGAPASPPLWQLLQVVAELVHDVRRGRSLTLQLDAVAPPLRSGAQALAFDVLRHLGTAQAVRERLVQRRPAAAVDALLCCALALLVRDGACVYPAFTLVNQTIEAAKRRADTRMSAGFLNACLRRFLREQPAHVRAVASQVEARWNHPTWWVERLRRDHPTHWRAILAADQLPAPMDLRVHLGRTSVAAYLERLASAAIAGTALSDAAVRLERPRPVWEIPGHEAGWVSVQSATAQRAAPLLLAGMTGQPRVLDACAAPGGKTAHILEHLPGAQVTALEVNAERSRRIQNTLARLGLRATVQVADAGDTSAWWDGQAYDAILLDVPCSASGIVRRHPDIRWLRRDTDVAALALQQDRLLAALWPVLAPGGRLLYCTCSVFREEGDERIRAFRARNADARVLPSPGHLLPSHAAAGPPVGDNPECDADGFFYALLEKHSP